MPQMVTTDTTVSKPPKAPRRGGPPGFGRVMVKGLKRLEKVSGVFNIALMIVAGVSLIAMMLIVVINIIVRKLGMQMLGAEELAGFAGVLVIASALGYTQQRKDNVAVDIFTRKFPLRVNRIIDLFKYLLKLAFAGVICWYGVSRALQIRESGEVSETLKIIFYPLILWMALGFAAFACTVVVDILRTLVNLLILDRLNPFGGKA